jgi:hypothetical protein
LWTGQWTFGYQSSWCSGNSLDLYMGSAYFKSQLGQWLSSLGFLCGSPQSLQANAEIVPQLGHNHFPLNPFHSIIHLSSYHFMLHSLWYWKHHKIAH